MKKVLAVLLTLCLVAALGFFGSNIYVTESVRADILTLEQAKQLKDVDCILVLGCLVWSENNPSSMLQDRLTVGIALYKEGVAPKLLMSGDHGTKTYDEVNTMKTYAVEKHVPAEDVFMDHAGFSTYESMYRAKEIFGAKKIVIVTQNYHMYRALYDAQKLGLEAYGVISDLHTYGKTLYNNTREAAARCKDFIWCIVRPKPTYLGEPISLSGSGEATDG